MGKENGFSPNGHEDRFPRLPVTSEHQGVLAKWQELVYDGPADVVGRLRQFEQESHEVIQEIDGEPVDFINNLPPERRDLLGEEVVDTIIAGLVVLDTLGLNFEVMFYKKLDTMYKKYQPGRVQGLVDQGMSRQDALSHLKREWQQNGDTHGSTNSSGK